MNELLIFCELVLVYKLITNGYLLFRQCEWLLYVYLS